MTIVNTTLPTHTFYPGSVVIHVTPQGTGSIISITGTGSGANGYLNDVVGYAFFGSRAIEAALSCFPFGASSAPDDSIPLSDPNWEPIGDGLYYYNESTSLGASPAY
jgi:hypothetical protein